MQQQEVRKNYIGVLSEVTEEQRALDSLSQSTPFMRDYLRGLMASLFNRRKKAA